jgi:hypothetical protein
MPPLKVKLIRRTRAPTAAADAAESPVAANAQSPVPLIDTRLFDTAYYLQQNPDVAAAGIDPLTHFLASGWQEGRNPSAWFSFRYYLANSPDVASSGAHPLAHYSTHGWREARDPSESFSLAKYLNAYPDVRAAGMDPLLHYMLYGRADRRVAFHV